MALWANEIAGNRTSSENTAATPASAFWIERMMRTSKRSQEIEDRNA
jgi:hypothetical protein